MKVLFNICTLKYLNLKIICSKEYNDYSKVSITIKN